MPDYRLYHLDSDGRIVEAFDLLDVDEAEAVAAVREQDRGHGLELWQGAKLIIGPDRSAPRDQEQL